MRYNEGPHTKVLWHYLRSSKWKSCCDQALPLHEQCWRIFLWKSVKKRIGASHECPGPLALISVKKYQLNPYRSTKKWTDQRMVQHVQVPPHRLLFTAKNLLKRMLKFCMYGKWTNENYLKRSLNIFTWKCNKYANIQKIVNKNFSLFSELPQEPALAQRFSKQTDQTSSQD